MSHGEAESPIGNKGKMHHGEKSQLSNVFGAITRRASFIKPMRNKRNASIQIESPLASSQYSNDSPPTSAYSIASTHSPSASINPTQVSPEIKPRNSPMSARPPSSLREESRSSPSDPLGPRTIVLTTLDHEALTTVDLSSLTNPAAVRERILTRLQIDDDDFARCTVHASAIGQTEDGPTLKDHELWDLCRKATQAAMPPLFLVRYPHHPPSNRSSALSGQSSNTAHSLRLQTMDNASQKSDSQGRNAELRSQYSQSDYSEDGARHGGEPSPLRSQHPTWQRARPPPQEHQQQQQPPMNPPPPMNPHNARRPSAMDYNRPQPYAQNSWPSSHGQNNRRGSVMDYDQGGDFADPWGARNQEPEYVDPQTLRIQQQHQEAAAYRRRGSEDPRMHMVNNNSAYPPPPDPSYVQRARANSNAGLVYASLRTHRPSISGYQPPELPGYPAPPSNRPTYAPQSSLLPAPPLRRNTHYSMDDMRNNQQMQMQNGNPPGWNQSRSPQPSPSYLPPPNNRMGPTGPSQLNRASPMPSPSQPRVGPDYLRANGPPRNGSISGYSPGYGGYQQGGPAQNSRSNLPLPLQPGGNPRMPYFQDDMGSQGGYPSSPGRWTPGMHGRDGSQQRLGVPASKSRPDLRVTTEEDNIYGLNDNRSHGNLNSPAGSNRSYNSTKSRPNNGPPAPSFWSENQPMPVHNHSARSPSFDEEGPFGESRAYEELDYSTNSGRSPHEPPQIPEIPIGSYQSQEETAKPSEWAALVARMDHHSMDDDRSHTPLSQHRPEPPSSLFSPGYSFNGPPKSPVSQAVSTPASEKAPSQLFTSYDPDEDDDDDVATWAAHMMPTMPSFAPVSNAPLPADSSAILSPVREDAEELPLPNDKSQAEKPSLSILTGNFRTESPRPDPAAVRDARKLDSPRSVHSKNASEERPGPPPHSASAASLGSNKSASRVQPGSANSGNGSRPATAATGNSSGSEIVRRSSFAQADDDWAFRPPVEQVYDQLENFFPNHDLDKPVIVDPNATMSPASGAQTPSIEMVTPPPLAESVPMEPQFSTELEKPSAPAKEKKMHHRKSIKSVAQNRRKDMQRDKIAKNASSSTMEKPLRRKSTKMWGNRIEEMRPGQSISAARSAGDETDPDNFSFKWVKGELIGKGTYGQVYLALNATTGDMLAVKQVELPRSASDKDDERQHSVVEALKSEIETLKNLDHPKIVAYLGFEQTDRHLSIFLEYVSGGSVGRCLRKHGKFEVEVVQSFTTQILEGLSYIHNKGILHRDLKADNMLVDINGICKISDFGISKKSNDIYSNNSNMSMQGTIFWMAPEVVHNQRKGYSAKVDIWSLGCVVLEMFAGRRPWENEEAIQAMFKLGAERQAPPIPDDVTLTNHASHFLKECFAIQPENRPKADKLLRHKFLTVPKGWQFSQSNLYKAIVTKSNKH